MPCYSYILLMILFYHIKSDFYLFLSHFENKSQGISLGKDSPLTWIQVCDQIDQRCILRVNPTYVDSRDPSLLCPAGMQRQPHVCEFKWLSQILRRFNHTKLYVTIHLIARATTTHVDPSCHTVHFHRQKESTPLAWIQV